VQAVKGEINMTDALEETFNNLSINVVPKSWKKRAYPSMKPFASWFNDFVGRVQFFREALMTRPKMYWISAFFFPQGFLTSILQIYARKVKVPVDTLNFQFIFKQQGEKDCSEVPPADGALIYGLSS
jgi:dynein heavy chain